MSAFCSPTRSIYTLLRIINVEKRRDTARGNRYLVELELMERGQRTVRLSEYIYVLLHQGKSEDSTEVNPEGTATMSTESQPPPSAWSLLYGKPILCRPLRLSWRHEVMVHFVVPGERLSSLSQEGTAALTCPGDQAASALTHWVPRA